VSLIKRCLDSNPSNRPTAKEIRNILYPLWNDIDNQIELKKQTKAEEVNNSIVSLTGLALSYKTHSEAIYTSRLLNFNDLPEPKDSDDYYEQNDDIISNEYSGN
jgi:serine/threonine protein kinase